jgi:predicted acyl esterase
MVSGEEEGPPELTFAVPQRSHVDLFREFAHFSGIYKNF